MLEIDALARPGLAPVSLRLDDGECVAIEGPSGAGKTLFLRAIADLDPTSGTVRLDGAERGDISGPDWRRRVTYLPAEPGWWADRVADHFPEDRNHHPLLAALGLDAQLLDQPVARLSTGERQRLALIRVLLLVPRVYLLDEPTAALDASATAAVEAVIAARLADGAAALWVSHDPAQARRLAARALKFAGGRAEAAAL
jgi:phosphate-transporting ATPase